ncbi:6173_t:CDS:10 [Funneliformis geosporum]|uniref:Alpha-galactosidase n=1 Tax=Funneliformis geosporum TaxID=1117311 RepID=A0A9W4SPA2_9GLOM|nr:6173_t:CDS:10 [Funneliformis geosporum]
MIIGSAGVHFPVFITLFYVAYFVINGVNSLNNGVGRTPPMGWNSWNKFQCGIDEKLIKDTADALINHGLADVGYKYLNIALSDYAHSKGLLFGIYSDAGFLTCAKRPGSLGYEKKDAMTYASWEIDYLKYDNCYNDTSPEQQRYQAMRDALNATGRPIFYSICEWGISSPHLWGSSVGNSSWRTTEDIHPSWLSILNILGKQERITKYAGPGGWNDPDMLQVGNGNLTIDEQKSHFSLWAALKSPLLLGFDIRTPPVDTLKIVKNTEIIAINQDKLGKSVFIVQRTSSWDIWTGELSDGHVARESSTTIELNFATHLNIRGAIAVRDLWEHEDKGVHNNSYSYLVPKHGITVLKLTGGIMILEDDFVAQSCDDVDDLFEKFYEKSFDRNSC